MRLVLCRIREYGSSLRNYWYYYCVYSFLAAIFGGQKFTSAHHTWSAWSTVQKKIHDLWSDMGRNSSGDILTYPDYPFCEPHPMGARDPLRSCLRYPLNGKWSGKVLIKHCARWWALIRMAPWLAVYPCVHAIKQLIRSRYFGSFYIALFLTSQKWAVCPTRKVCYTLHIGVASLHYRNANRQFSYAVWLQNNQISFIVKLTNHRGKDVARNGG